MALDAFISGSLPFTFHILTCPLQADFSKIAHDLSFCLKPHLVV